MRIFSLVNELREIAKRYEYEYAYEKRIRRHKPIRILNRIRILNHKTMFDIGFRLCARSPGWHEQGINHSHVIAPFRGAGWAV